MNYIEALNSNLPKEIDCLLLCASFEERCLSLTHPLENVKFSNVGIFYFEKFKKFSSSNLLKLTNHFETHGIPLDYSNPISTADSLIVFFNTISKQDNISVLIDISTFTRESLLIVLKFLDFVSDRLSEVYCFYRAANVSRNLSDAVVSIRSIIGYMGDVNVEDPLHLIILSGFEHERAKEIIDTLEPDHITIGYASQEGSINSELYKSNMEFTKTLIAYYSDTKIDTFEHSLLDPESVRNKILRIVQSKPQYSSVVAPLNNKISTLGAGLAAIANPKIQLCYAEMGNYNVNTYSTPTDDGFVFKVNL